MNDGKSYSQWQKVIHIASSLPEVYEKLCHGTPAFYVEKKFFTRIKEDAKTLVVYNSDRDEWIASDGDVFFITDHYKDYPILLVDLERVSTTDLRTLLSKSWKLRASKTMLKNYPCL